MKYSTKFLLLASTAVLGLAMAEENASANKVNDYVIAKGWTPSGNTVAISNDLPKNGYRNGVGKPEGVVVHETANASDKWNDNAIWTEINYMLGHYNSAFVHSFVDANNRIEIGNPDYLAWGAGPTANSRYIQTEQVEVEGKDAFAGELYNLATIQARYLQKYNLKPVLGKTVFSHAMTSTSFGETNHTDPNGYWADMAARFYGTTYTMNDYQVLLEYVYNQIAGGVRWENGNLHGYDSAGNQLRNVWWNFNGLYYYFDGNGNALMDLQKLDGKWYFFDQGAQVRGKWWSVDGKWYYFSSTDGVAKTGFQKIDDQYYYFDTTSAVQTRNSWKTINGKKYYFGNDGRAQIGASQIDGKWYWFDSDGVMQETPKRSWVAARGKWYYFDENGNAANGKQKIDDKWYIFDNAAQVRNAWWNYNGSWYYLGTEGVAYTGLQTISGNKYYFDEKSAEQLRNAWQTVDGKEYYFGSDGVAFKNGLLTLSTGYRFIENNYNVVKNKWWNYNGSWYYFKANGIAAMDLLQIDGKWYFFQAGKQVRGAWWYVPSTDGWYYFNGSDGTAKTGLQVIDGKTYYFYPDTAKQARNVTLNVNGKQYSFGPDGVAK